MSAGKVTLVGAGPGAPDLLTVRGERALRAAEAVVYDALASSELLELAPPEALRIDVGRRGHAAAARTQEEINALLVRLAREGRQVVRLKGGDPFVFGRGGEEVTACQEAGIAVEVVPGISSALAGPAWAGIPVSDRRFGASFAVVTGHKDPTRATASLDWEALARVDTLVVLMGMRNLEEIVEQLLDAGRSAATPAAVVMNATREEARAVVAPLSALPERARQEDLGSPAVIVVGDVVRLQDPTAWRDALPLLGLRVLLTRTEAQAEPWVRALRLAGAEPSVRPMIRIEEIRGAGVEKAVAALPSYDGLLLTSANAVRALVARAGDSGLVLSDCAPPTWCVGPATAAAARAAGLPVAASPKRTDADGLLALLDAEGRVRGRRFLLPRAERGRERLPEGLRAAGAEVDVEPFYRTLSAEPDEAELRGALLAGQWDAIVFASPSAVRPFCAALDEASREALSGVRIVALGGVTADALRERDIEPDVVPPRAETSALLLALAPSGEAADR